MPDKIATHKGVTCNFNEENHLYTIKGTLQRLTSVTSLIRRYTPPFDSAKMAQRMVDTQNKKYTGMTVEQIQKQWSDKAELASMEGTELHSLLERWPEKGLWGWLPISYRVLMMGKQIDRMMPKLFERFKLIESEKVVFSSTMGLAGQIDLIMFDEKTGEGILLDFKTNEKITDDEGAFGNMLPPLEHLTDADTVKYGLQLALYEKMLIDENFYPEFSGYRKSLIHIREMAGKVVKVENYRDEIERLIKGDKCE